LTVLIAEEQRVAMRQALVRLDPGDTDLLRLAYYEQMGAEQIAVRLGTTAGAVRVRKHRALRRLAELLGSGVSNTGASSGT
jgi:RNA polymerase sigma-70 factor (ECF subfamily)